MKPIRTSGRGERQTGYRIARLSTFPSAPDDAEHVEVLENVGENKIWHKSEWHWWRNGEHYALAEDLGIEELRGT